MTVHEQLGRTFGRKLDRAVTTARVLFALDIAGRMAVAAGVAMATIEAARRLDCPSPSPWGTMLVVAAAGIAGWMAARGRRVPDRLSTAISRERAQPALGERISRAVGLDAAAPSVDGPGSIDATARRLAEEALADAIDAIDDCPRGTLRDTLVAIRWPVAGITAMMAAAAAGIGSNPPREQGTVPASATSSAGQPAEPTRLLPPEARAAAARLAEAAAAEERLASSLLDSFAAMPGIAREALPRVDRERLDETAALHASIAEAMNRDVEVVAKALASAHPRLLLEFIGEGAASRTKLLGESAEAIRDHQLAAAAQRILHEVSPILSALASIGVHPSSAESRGPAADRDALVRRRLDSRIDSISIAGRGYGESSRSQAHSTLLATRLAPAASATADTAAGREAGRSVQPGESPRGSAGGAAAGGMAGSPSERTTVAGTPADAESLPAWVRSREPRPEATLVGDALGIPLRYRDAVDDYYRRLWRSAADGETEEPSP